MGCVRKRIRKPDGSCHRNKKAHAHNTNVKGKIERADKREEGRQADPLCQESLDVAHLVRFFLTSSFPSSFQVGARLGYNIVCDTDEPHGKWIALNRTHRRLRLPRREAPVC